jgi:putative component of membrane protein insertase Oxa1/YidC/SpoIIIJ protein YidD
VGRHRVRFVVFTDGLLLLAALASDSQANPHTSPPTELSRPAEGAGRMSAAARPAATGSLRPVGPGHLMDSALFFIYQRGAGPSKGQKCPMSPSCSEYGRRAVERFGFLKGAIMTADRLHRCGHDLRYYPTVFDDRGAGSWDPPESAR